MRSIHVFGMGFTQTLGGNSGQIALWQKARRHSSAAHCILSPFPWKTDAQEVALFLQRLATPTTRVFGYFYSWGCGVFFRDLAAHMSDRGLSFDTVVLCDPVARSRLFPKWLPLNPTSLLSFHRIVVPSNVSVLHHFYQRENLPCGHDLRIEDEARTRLASQTRLFVKHEQMEDQPEYHDLVLNIVRETTQ